MGCPINGPLSFQRGAEYSEQVGSNLNVSLQAEKCKLHLLAKASNSQIVAAARADANAYDSAPAGFPISLKKGSRGEIVKT